MMKRVALLALAAAANAASLKDVKHVIMVMMENRSFQHVSIYMQPLYAVYIIMFLCSDSDSTSVPWQVFGALPTLMFRSIPMAAPYGTSK
jgi:hypothetical protein